MVNEDDVIKFLVEHGESTLEEISSALKIPKYGPNSAYAFLYSLKLKNVVERRGSRWALISREESIPVETRPTASETKPSIEGAIESLAKVIKEVIVKERVPTEEMATLTTIEVKERSLKMEEIKTLRSLKTGTFLDALFLGFDGKPLNGIPASGQFMIVGPLGAGKSLLASEISLRLASLGHRVLYILLDDSWKSEAQTFDLQSRVKIRADSLNLNWNRITVNLRVLNPRDIDEGIIGEFRGIISSGIDLIVVDPVNRLLKSGDYGLADRLMTEIIDANRFFGITGIFVVHANMHESSSVQGQFIEQIRYLMDGVISMSPVQTMVSGVEVNVRGLSHLRVVQVISCRLCGFDNNGVLVNIMPSGLIQPIITESDKR